MRSVAAFVAASAIAAGLWAPSPAIADDGHSTTVLPLEVEVSEALTSHLESLGDAAASEFADTMLPATLELTEGAQLPADAEARTTVQHAQATETLLTPTAAGCWTKRVDGVGYAAGGNALYSLYHAGAWCANGSAVTSASVADRGGQVHTVGWRYDGAVGGQAGIVSNQGRSYSQMKFVLGAGGWDVQTQLPCLRVRGTIGGGSASEAICGIY